MLEYMISISNWNDLMQTEDGKCDPYAVHTRSLLEIGRIKIMLIGQ